METNIKIFSQKLIDLINEGGQNGVPAGAIYYILKDALAQVDVARKSLIQAEAEQTKKAEEEKTDKTNEEEA